MKVLHVAETIQGGVGAHLEEIVPRQVAMLGAAAVRVIVPDDERRYFPGIPAEVTEGFARKRRRLHNIARLAGMIRNARRTFGPDIVHAHSSFAGVAARLPALIGFGSVGAIVYCPHGWSFAANGPGASAYAAAERLLSHAADAIITVSQYERDLALARGLDAKRLHVLRNGIADALPAMATPDGFPTDRLNLVFVGRLDHQKGFDILLDAMRRVSTTVHAHVIGSSVREVAVDPQSPARNVTLHGWQPRATAMAFIAACDAVVMPSRWEGLPLVALEAMRAGKPILASDRSSMPEVVEDGVNGRLFAIDDGAMLAEVIDRLTRDDLQRWGAAGRQRFEREFTVERQSAEILALYDDVLKMRGNEAHG